MKWIIVHLSNLNFNPHINKSLNTKNFINIKEPGGVELTELLIELREILNVEEVKLFFVSNAYKKTINVRNKYKTHYKQLKFVCVVSRTRYATK